VAARRRWFQNQQFRQAVSAAIDRESLVSLVYQGRGTPIWSLVSPGNKGWFHHRLARPPRSVERARELLAAAGFRWTDAALEDESGRGVAFTMITNAGNAERIQMMAIIQEDLRQLGIKVQTVPLEMGTLIERVLETRDYDLCVLGLGGGDSDPNPMMNVLLSSGGMHLWNPTQPQPATAWEAEIDRLMTEQATVLDYERRKAIYDRVQELMADKSALVPLVSPNVLVGAKTALGNFEPAILDPHILWNADELFWRAP
jgi:peptide/nickel transport system substrate-binding protein